MVLSWEGLGVQNHSLRRCKQAGYCTPDIMSTITEQMNDADDKLFSSILGNHQHVLQYYLADSPDAVYNLWPRKHNKTVVI